MTNKHQVGNNHHIYIVVKNLFADMTKILNSRRIRTLQNAKHITIDLKYDDHHTWCISIDIIYVITYNQTPCKKYK